MGAILVSCRDLGKAEEHYAAALREAGWTGELRLRSPLDPEPASLEAALAGISGLLLTGGWDIHPRNWDPAEPLHPTAEVDEARDAQEIPLILEAWKRRIPIFGICRGEQILNVALGGSLIQDIPDHFGCPPERHQHGSAEEPGELHPVEIRAGTRLAALLGAARVPVNSRHHQAVGRLAPELALAAAESSTAGPEGLLVEAVEARDPRRWVLGVQWHPENLVHREDAAGRAARALFAGFLEALAEPA